MSLLLDLLCLAATPEPRALSTAEATGVAVHLAIVTLKLAIAAALRRVQTHEGARVGSRHPDALSAGGDAERNGHGASRARACARTGWDCATIHAVRAVAWPGRRARV